MAKVINIHNWLLAKLNPQEAHMTDERDEFKKHVSDQVYHALESAGNLCRLRCQDDPDLLDSMAEGIYRFLSDGDVFDQVMVTLLTRDPKYFGEIISRMDVADAKTIIANILE